MGSGFIHHYLFRAYVSILHHHWYCMVNRLGGMSFDPIHHCSTYFKRPLHSPSPMDGSKDASAAYQLEGDEADCFSCLHNVDSSPMEK